MTVLLASSVKGAHGKWCASRARLLLLLSAITACVIDAAFAIPGTLELQNGRLVAGRAYAGTLDAGISTQYAEAWNDHNGVFYPVGTESFALWDIIDGRLGSDYAFRYLLRFDQLHQLLPAGTSITSAQLTLWFENWAQPVDVEACYLTRAWQAVAVGPPYKGTGWVYSRYTTTSEPWTQPGAWADCDSQVTLAMTGITGDTITGRTSRMLQLDPRRVAAWLAHNGAANYGLLFKSPRGSAHVEGSNSSSMSRRPLLSITYSSTAPTPSPTPLPAQPSPGARSPSPGSRSPSPLPSPYTIPSTARTIWVSPTGNDDTGLGTQSSPLRTPMKALQDAAEGDTINLRAGVYAGGFSIIKARITLQSAPEEVAVIASPVNDPVASTNVITIRTGAHNGVLRNLEVVGGFHYGIFFFTDWENFSPTQAATQAVGIHGWLLEGLRVHHTGSSAIKLSMKTSSVTITNTEVYSAGYRLKIAGHGIDAHQTYDVMVQDCYIHDVPGAGIRLQGGSTNGQVLRNHIANAGYGVVLGFGLEVEYLDPTRNPQLYECLDCAAINNIIAYTQNAGVYLGAARNARVQHNTIWQAQQAGQAGVTIAGFVRSDVAGSPNRASTGVSVVNNIIAKSAAARAGPVLQIRNGGLDPGAAITLAGNIYFDARGISGSSFVWGQGAMQEDERSASAFISNLPGWTQHCRNRMGVPQCEAGSREADPALTSTFAPLACSPAVNGARTVSPAVTTDFHGRTRVSRDIGAVASSALGPLKPWPPVPSLFAGRASYSGPASPPDYDRSWPYDFWYGRRCVDIWVSPDTGDDSQQFNYESNYTRPFRTIAAALGAINQCDRIILAGGRAHPGPFGIYRPNVTILSEPGSASRAQVTCTGGSADQPCIILGDGLYDGAAHVTLQGFDIVMSGGARGSCVHFNEGQGGGGSPYWDFYLASRGLATSNYPYSVLQDLRLRGCGAHGIKFSTFISNVVVQRVDISGAGASGIDARGGANLIIQDSTIQDVAHSGIVLGGGARNCVVQRNTIRWYGERGILLGSDQTEAEYMDVDYAHRRDGGQFHDNIGTRVQFNVVRDGNGAGIGFISARDAVVTRNTFFNITSAIQAGVLFDVSPKLIGPTQEVAAPNHNITFASNIVVLSSSAGAGAAEGQRPVVEYRAQRATLPAAPPAFQQPPATCPARRLVSLDQGAADSSWVGEHKFAGPKLMEGTGREEAGQGEAGMEQADSTPASSGESVEEDAEYDFGSDRRQLLQQSGRKPDGSCPVFPADNWWNLDISQYPVHSRSDVIMARMNPERFLHPDFGGGEEQNGGFVLYGIPFVTVDSSDGNPPLRPVDVVAYEDESDPGNYAIPSGAPVEGSFPGCLSSVCDGDRHVLVIDNATCILQELYVSVPPSETGTGRWQANAAVKFDLLTNNLRPYGWTSADAAGLPIYPGLVKVDEIVSGVITHAIRFTTRNSRRGFSLPATHYAPSGYTGPDAPWMGLRVRLRASYNCNALRYAARVFCNALKVYGGILADNGSPWFFSGEASARWAPYVDELQDIKSIPGSALQVINSGCVCLDDNCVSRECDSSGPTPTPTPTPRPSPNPSPSPLRSPSPRPSPSPSPRPSPNLSPSPLRSPSPRTSPTPASPKPSPSPTPRPSPSRSPTPTPVPSPSPANLPWYNSVMDNSIIFSNNIYHQRGGLPGRYVDRRTGAGQAYDGSFPGWQSRVGDYASIEADPQLGGDLVPVPGGTASRQGCGAL